MDYINPEPLFNTPEYYNNPTNTSAFGQLANDVKKENQQLILVTEYVKSESIKKISNYVVTFEKLKKNFRISTYSFGLAGQTALDHVYIKGVINFNDNTQSSISGLSNLQYADKVITLTLPYSYYSNRTPVSATLRISQLE